MISKGNKRSIVTAVATFVGAAMTVPAMAQLEEVIVTATKRSESLQDVPMSISAMSGDRSKIWRSITSKSYQR